MAPRLSEYPSARSSGKASKDRASSQKTSIPGPVPSFNSLPLPLSPSETLTFPPQPTFRPLFAKAHNSTLPSDEMARKHTRDTSDAAYLALLAQAERAMIDLLPFQLTLNDFNAEGINSSTVSSVLQLIAQKHMPSVQAAAETSPAVTVPNEIKSPTKPDVPPQIDKPDAQSRKELIKQKLAGLSKPKAMPQNQKKDLNEKLKARLEQLQRAKMQEPEATKETVAIPGLSMLQDRSQSSASPVSGKKRPVDVENESSSSAPSKRAFRRARTETSVVIDVSDSSEDEGVIVEPAPLAEDEQDRTRKLIPGSPAPANAEREALLTKQREIEALQQKIKSMEARRRGKNEGLKSPAQTEGHALMRSIEDFLQQNATPEASTPASDTDMKDVTVVEQTPPSTATETDGGVVLQAEHPHPLEQSEADTPESAETRSEDTSMPDPASTADVQAILLQNTSLETQAETESDSDTSSESSASTEPVAAEEVDDASDSDYVPLPTSPPPNAPLSISLLSTAESPIPSASPSPLPVAQPQLPAVQPSLFLSVYHSSLAPLHKYPLLPTSPSVFKSLPSRSYAAASVPSLRDTSQILCRFETAGGTCNDQTCEELHFRVWDVKPQDYLLYLSSLIEGDAPAEREQYRVGLREVVKQILAPAEAYGDEQDASSRLAAAIIRFRASFLGEDRSKLGLDVEL